MTFRRLLSVALINVRRDRRGFLLSSLGVSIGVAAFVYFMGLGEGVARVVREEIFPVDTRHVKVVPQRLSLGSFLGGGVLDDEAVERLASLEGVARRYRKVELEVPGISQYDGDFFGRRVRMGVDIMGVGVDPDFVREDIADGYSFEDPGEDEWIARRQASPPDTTVPVVVSRRLLEIYNTTFAPARRLPRIDDAQLIGFKFPLTLGASYVARPGRMSRRTVMLEVVGVSDRSLLLGVTLPIETVQRWNAMAKEDPGEPDRYSAVVLVAEGQERASRLIPEVRAAGFEVDETEARLAEEAGSAVRMTAVVLSTLSFVILGLAAVSIGRAAYAHVAARTREVGVMRAVGARRVHVASIVLSESVLAGFVGGIAGLLLALVGAWTTDLLVASFVADFPFKPESFFVFPSWLPFAGFAAALLAAGVGALLPAVAAARLDPVKALAGGTR